MNLFGHHLALPSGILALIDGALFIIALYALGLAGGCSTCALHSVTHLGLFEALLLTAAFICITASIGLYNSDAHHDIRIFIRRFILASQFVLIPAVASVAIVKAASGLPFGWFVGILTLAIAFFFFILFVIRLCLLWWFDVPFLKRRVLIFGSGSLSEMVHDFIKSHGTSHLRFVGQLSNTVTLRDASASIGNTALQPQADMRPRTLLDEAQALKAEEIVIAVKDRRGLPVWQLLECKLRGIQITDYLTFWERETGQLDLETVGPGWLAFADGFHLNRTRRVIKRIIDIVASVLFLTLALPVGLVVALLIRLDSRGPIFYAQERVGKDGHVFRIWKFRSMRVDAEKDGVPRWAAVRDDRVTAIGGIIRKLRIDEFPQVFNVLKGDMSFIGPRPERPFFVEQLRKQMPLYDLRHRVRPGITGWAQVKYQYAASAEDAKRKLAYDLYYVKNQDVVLDMMILMQTVRVFLFSHGSR